MVWYQLAGLQGSAAKSQSLAHKHKRKQNTAAAAVRLSGESKADLYNNITENWIAKPVGLTYPTSPLRQPDRYSVLYGLQPRENEDIKALFDTDDKTRKHARHNVEVIEVCRGIPAAYQAS